MRVSGVLQETLNVLDAYQFQGFFVARRFRGSLSLSKVSLNVVGVLLRLSGQFEFSGIIIGIQGFLRWFTWMTRYIEIAL